LQQRCKQKHPQGLTLPGTRRKIALQQNNHAQGALPPDGKAEKLCYGEAGESPALSRNCKDGEQKQSHRYKRSLAIAR
jgi:hypothetical protein